MKLSNQLLGLLLLGTLPFYYSCTEEKHDHDHGEHAHEEGGDHAHAEEDGEHKHGEGEGDDHGHGEHDHDHGKIVAGPNGGRLLVSVEPHIEFFVTKDRKVQLSLFDHDNKAIPVTNQKISVTGGDRSDPTRLTFAKQGDLLVSENTLPDGNDFPVVIQINMSPDAEAVFEKFNLNLLDCPTCDNLEYACTCDHAH